MSPCHTNHRPRCTLGTIVGALLLALTAGCESLSNPFAGSPPVYKQQYGMTPLDKINRLETLAKQIGGKPAQEQAQLTNRLSASLAQEQDPLIRREIIRTLGNVTGPPADRTLTAATTDPNPLVRAAACQAWGRRPGPAGVQVLASLLSSDADVDVRLAASRALGRMPAPQAVQVLGASLESSDPAIQLVVMDSLQRVTGQNLGQDINAWHEYLQAGRAATPSLDNSNVQQATATMMGPSPGSLSR